ncbi:hypothetical protein ON010_g7369 [Phytophthora cinnamomi]|nr:hypothetical protein ON010_g7369 [Phytophthora cinnamomi]
MTFFYPQYIFAYVSLTGIGQAAFALVSPVIQLIAKNWISRNLTDHNDIKPVTIIFYAEVFDALYASSVLQGRSSWKTALVIVGTDIVQFGLAAFDVLKLMNDSNLESCSNIAVADITGISNRSLETIFSREERALFIEKVSQILFVTEYIMLEEYIEVAMPIIFSYPTLHQLVFVLEKHAGTIQLTLIAMFVYIMQLSLKHVGADFSFKFSWLHTGP